MEEIKLYTHQIEALEKTKNRNRVAYYLDMGLGKTFVGSEKMKQLNEEVNLLICQKSKIEDWIQHFNKYYPEYQIIDLTKTKDIEPLAGTGGLVIYVINYELSFRRPFLKELHDFTLILDESSLIQNEMAKRSKFILGLDAKNIILLSGTPTSGKYENLWSQCQLLGWNINKKHYWDKYIRTRLIDVGAGFHIPIVIGYQNIRELKQNLRDHGAVFMKSEEVFDLPEQIDTSIMVDPITSYKQFMKHSIVEIEGEEIVGDNILTKMLYARQICGQYNKNKLNSLKEMIESTNDRLIIFYNFTKEMELIKELCQDRPISIINGETKDLTAYEENENSITLIQYQAGAMGLNLQKANKVIYYTLPLSSELFEQSKKRVHRIGQANTCFYYYMMTKGTIEEKIFETLKMRKDYTNELFRNLIKEGK